MEILKESCIYKLYCNYINKVYIGHHKNFDADERLNTHKWGRNTTKCGGADLFKLVNNIEDVKIDIIYRYTDISLDQLKDYERQTIIEYGFYDNKLFNKCLPYGLEKEERQKKTKREYYERNKQKVIDKVNAKRKTFEGKEKLKERILCIECNKMILKCTKSRHYKTNKHLQNKNIT
jgi:hypothetical protein